MTDAPRSLPVPLVGAEAATAFVAEHLSHLVSGPVAGSTSIRGGQRAADAALASFDVAGYAAKRNEVAPVERRGASRLSPYIRHGLLQLRQVWDAVEGGPSRDVSKFRDELLWQEFARHWYARLGSHTRLGVRRELASSTSAAGWDRSMRCIDETVGELEADGWLVNQTRMWLSSQWAIRDMHRWQDGEAEFFRHLLDGSRAANRLGWQWTTGVGSSKHYGFSRWQVRKRAPGMCDSCVHNTACPIEDWPQDPTFQPVERPVEVKQVLDLLEVSGPVSPVTLGKPEVVWLTAESLGTNDPALLAHPALPVLFVFDEPLLRTLQLSAKRLVFLVETLAEIAETRDLRLVLGRPASVLQIEEFAVTFAPVPGFRRIVEELQPVDMRPWPWLRQPASGSVASFSAWRKHT